MRKRPGIRRTARRARTALGRGAVPLVCAGVVCLPGPAAGALTSPDDDHDATTPFWVEPTGPAVWQERIWQERGREEDAAALQRISDRSTAVWLTDRDPKAQAEQITRRAERAGRIPVLVAYNIPQRDCGQYSSGGAPDAAHYRRWISRAAAGIGSRQAWVVLEPDALAQWASGCVPEAAAKQRLALLAEAVRIFKERPGTAVYLDAGNPGWIPDRKRLADALNRAGVARADGFALNVSNFHTNSVTSAYGDELSALLGGAHYVVDTSRNGNGPLLSGGAPPDAAKPAEPGDGPPAAPAGPNGPAAGDDDGKGPGPSDGEPWCNPPGRALGTPPTTATGNPLIDAFLWIKRPGESDGTCRGAPPAGRWWADYALRLANTAPSAKPVPGPAAK
ncbi:glycoside hydrolase family 6 protein [Streptomyces sp. HU2014]|uniref:glycoside hydrolase family 6 protein n=1 Tax=Streptomyces sp. HU2014 TaxID=2939414 RepID=UPI00200CAFD6|nr:glycoside hydrolase family 6 protein [Streptomyces sp. HU2014]UQI45044.1 glycoside hydrolase family 6 protein [Streptomyces sp. HU2014]